ncbi:hypothetical protein EV426DRAFT_639554 [Tirmania nivea]|nr:hypothetical protein EV426DRAFT_639554 [Tirmania nivea]
MGNPNADAPPASSSSSSSPAKSHPPSDLSTSSSAGPSKPTPTNLLDLDLPNPDEPLPSYEDSTSLSTSAPTTDPVLSSDPPPFSVYQPTTHPHYLNSHLITHDPHLNTDGEALYQFLLQENLIPPIQHVQVRGSHEVRNTVWETDREGRRTTRSETRTVEDFRFRLDLTGGLWAVMQAGGGVEGLGEGGVLKVLGDEEKVYRGGRTKSRWREQEGRCQGNGQDGNERGCCGRKGCKRKGKKGRRRNQTSICTDPPGNWGLLDPTYHHDHDPEANLLPNATPTSTPDSQLPVRAWTDRYCHLPTTLKEFIVRKPITNLSKPLITSLITNQIRATNYRGSVSISFPKQKHKIAIYPDTQFARARNNPWVRWFFYLTFLWVVTWPILYFSTKKFHVVVSEWRWGWKGEKRVVREHGDNGEVRTVEKWVWLEEESEREWVRWWAQAVRCAARGRRMDNGVLVEWDREDAARVERELGGRACAGNIWEGGVLAGMSVMLERLNLGRVKDYAGGRERIGGIISNRERNERKRKLGWTILHPPPSEAGVGW